MGRVGRVKMARRALRDTSNPRQFIRTIHGKGVRFIAPMIVTPDSLSLIVVPFETLSENAEETYFTDGFSEDLITDLSRVSGLKTLSRNASFSLKKRQLGLDNLHATFDVTHALEGSVRRQGQALRINAQLLDLSDGQQIWADRFDGHGQDIFAAQDNIANRILASLKMQLLLRTSTRPTRDSTAYDLCLRGRSEYFQYSPKNMARALEYFEQAGAVDPEYAEVFAYQSYCRTAMHLFGIPGSDGTLMHAAKLAERAFEIESFVPPSWDFARAHSYILLRDYPKAIARILPVVEREPKFLPAQVQLARLFVETDQLDQAKQTVQTILATAPRFGMLNVKRMFPYPQPEERDRITSALLKTGMKG